MPTIDQIRAARALLNWSQTDLADRAGLSQTGIARIESGVNMPNSSTLDKIAAAFDDAGIEFIADRGVEKRRSDIHIFKGRQGFIDFSWDVYNTVRVQGGEIVVNNVDERKFAQWKGEENKKYHEAMRSLGNIHFKILIQEGDDFFLASGYAAYRWTPKEKFGSIPFYVYGDKVAIIIFEPDDVVIFVIDSEQLSNYFRLQFKEFWEISIEPKMKGGANA
jgi:transcriptional regulator with XRE-family HTH domain